MKKSQRTSTRRTNQILILENEAVFKYVNHVWIINGVIIDVLNKKTKEPIDLQVFDYKQCFDSLWLEECLNDVYDGGLTDDKFQILYNTNSIVNVVVKTPVGKTTREPITKAIIQGDVIGPLACSK